MRNWETLSAAFVNPCETLFHPSIDWREYRMEFEQAFTTWGNSMDHRHKRTRKFRYCCELDQKLSSSSALKFFANESKALNGTFLDEEFVTRNHELLTFDRTYRIKGKAPSNVSGYNIWKPYAILKGFCDLPHGSIVLYTDAGVMASAPSGRC